MKLKAQSAVMDGIIFVLVCAAASTLMFYTASLYGASTNRQIITIYNYEYEGTALVTLHYAKDSAGNWFWLELKKILSKNTAQGDVEAYFRNKAAGVWDNLVASSPSQDSVLYFSGPSSFYCRGKTSASVACGALPADFSAKTVFSSSVNLIDDSFDSWEVSMQMYY
ncbi:MAG: hypothetical protein QXO69_03090 [archaeon]